MGHIVSCDGLKLDPENIKCMCEWPVPTASSQVRAFLGLCSYYRRFVHSYAFIAHPLHRLTQKDVAFEWTDECSAAFQTLKDALTSAPIMAFPNFYQPFILSTDASNYAVGSVLSQVQNGEERVIAYASHVLTRAERKWSTYDKEFWAIVWSVRHFQYYLSSNPFTIITDHRPLLSLRKMDVTRDPTGQRARWSLELDPYVWTIIHKEGQRQGNADAMSRIPTLTQNPEDTEEKSQPPQGDPPASVNLELKTAQGLNVTQSQLPFDINTSAQVCTSLTDSSAPQPEDADGDILTHTFSSQRGYILAEQSADPVLAEVYTWVQGNKIPYLRKVKGRLQRKRWWPFPKLMISDGLLCKQANTATGKPSVLQVLIPQKLITETLHMLHGNPSSGHFSTDRTLSKALSMCYWPSMRSDIDQFCSVCPTCEAYRKPVPQNRAPIQSIQAHRPFQFVCTDITELPLTSKGNRYGLVVQDHFTKYVNAFPMHDQRAQTVAELLYERFMPEHGVPEELFSDQGRQFESEIMQTVCQRLQIQEKGTSPYHPRGNGMVEQFNRTLKEQLAKLIHRFGGEWDHFLPAVVLSFNSTPHSSTGYSPYFLVHGQEPCLPAAVSLSTPGLQRTPQNYGAELVSRLDAAFEALHFHREDQRLRHEYYYDRDTRFKPYEGGDLVWMDDPTAQRKKLEPN
uniref:Gypsy retrotransposon integrase-like protein 1 n=1 Tax=Nothobranchius furzeri TaxID=105023 RepID=A0A8C6L5C7_NOTFU